jgi:hypothetical protein
MNRPIVLVGVGEMGGVFARGFLRAGHPVFPVTREMDLHAAAMAVHDPVLVLVAVAEADLHAVLTELPEVWRDRLALLQNELLPRDWRRHGLEHPTVISVWFEKKRGREAKVILPSPAQGPGAGLLAAALERLEIPARVLDGEAELLEELVLKNLYILVSNICGLSVGGTVGELWRDHRGLALEVAADVLALQEHLAGHTLDHERLVAGLAEAFAADAAHQCQGRTAPQRLQRALEQAEAAGLDVPALRRIRAETA